MKEFCDERFVYSIDDSSGELRFTQFKVIARQPNAEVAGAIEEYFAGRALCDVDPNEVWAISGARECACLDDILAYVLELRRNVAKCPNDWERMAGREGQKG